MARHAKQAGPPKARGPQAEAVSREPSEEPTTEGHNPPVGKDDEPKGHPTSDRFQTEQAHRQHKKGV